MSESRRSGLLGGVLGLLAGGGAALIGLRNAWSTATVTVEGVPPTEVSATGASIAPGALGLAMVVMAAALGVVAASSRLRRWLGVLTAAVGVGAAVWVVLADPHSAQSAALAAAALSGTPADWQGTGWRWFTLAGLIVAVLTALWIARSGPNWSTMGSRYDAPGSSREPDPSDVWKSLDEGIDPTEE